jgi:ATP/maltotriose-dependent transcriptional regulator MalT
MVIDRWVGLLYAGRFAEAFDLCDALVADPAGGAPGFDASVALFQGRLHLLVGRPASAEARFREAIGALRVEDPSKYLEWALGLLAAACAQQGRADEARRAYDESERAADRTLRLFDADRRLVLAWVLAAEGQLTAARQQAEMLGLGAVANEQLSFGMMALHDAMRLGSTTAVLPLIDAAKCCDGVLAATVGAHARAVRCGDAEELSAAGEQLVAIGLDAPAAEAHICAAAAYQQTGKASSARAESARADAVLGRCEGIRTPVTTTRVVTHARLTPRELEIAGLAARGATNGEIAARLVTSTRTVEGHLLRAFSKLGISRRQDLRDVLGQGAPKDA